MEYLLIGEAMMQLSQNDKEILRNVISAHSGIMLVIKNKKKTRQSQCLEIKLYTIK